MTVLIDTNVMLDYVMKREPFAQDALNCLEKLISGKAKVYLTTGTITDINSVARRTLHDAAAATGVTAKLLNAFQIVGIDKADCVKALDVSMDNFEDALVSICATKAKADYIITQNTKHNGQSPVPSISPTEFLKVQMAQGTAIHSL